MTLYLNCWDVSGLELDEVVILLLRDWVVILQTRNNLCTLQGNYTNFTLQRVPKANFALNRYPIKQKQMKINRKYLQAEFRTDKGQRIAV